MNSVRQYVLGILIGLFIAVPIQAKTVDNHYLNQFQINSLNNQFHYQSLVKAKALAIETEILKLVSQKAVDFLQEQSDSSGILTREIKDKGHQKETVIAATIEAENITVNGQNINEALTTANIEKQILRTLSSQDSLTQALKDQGIDLQALTAENKEWDESMTTLSGVGQIVVQVVVAYFTAGAGNALVMGATEAAKQTLMQQALAAAVQSVVLQGVSQLATSAITGNAPSFDVASIIKGALVAGATAYAGSYINAEDGLGLTKGSFSSEAVNTVAKAGIDTAVNGGSFEDNLVNATIDTVGANVAKGIGAADLDGLTHKLAHAGLGCALGSAKGGDCASGAVGAVAAEIAAELYYKDEDLAFKSEEELKQLKTETKLVGELVAVAAAIITNSDVETAYEAGSNAVDNNALNDLQRQFLEADMQNLVTDGKLTQEYYEQVINELDQADQDGAEALVAFLSLVPVGKATILGLQGGKELIKRYGVTGLKKIVGKLKIRQIQNAKNITSHAKDQMIVREISTQQLNNILKQKPFEYIQNGIK